MCMCDGSVGWLPRSAKRQSERVVVCVCGSTARSDLPAAPSTPHHDMRAVAWMYGFLLFSATLASCIAFVLSTMPAFTCVPHMCKEKHSNPTHSITRSNPRSLVSDDTPPMCE
jgi:hypothetical protein